MVLERDSSGKNLHHHSLAELGREAESEINRHKSTSPDMACSY